MSRPWMIAGTLIVAVAVSVMISLGFWQLRRLDERRAINEVRRSIRVAPRVALPDAPPPERRLEHPAYATGTFEGPQFTIINRGYKGAPGVDIVSTFRLTTGEYLLVDRGFVPLPSRYVAPAPPTGVTSLRGYLVVDTGDDTRDPHPETLQEFDWVRIDPVRMSASLGPPAGACPECERGDDRGRAYLPYWLVATENLGDGKFPIEKDLPPMDDGPHASYAIQWFSFAAINGVGWLFLLYRRRRS